MKKTHGFRHVVRPAGMGLFLSMLLSLPPAAGAEASKSREADFEVYPFGSGGQLKMIYDRRQRPQAVYINDMVYMVYNGGAPPDTAKRATTFPFVVSYDPSGKRVSSPMQLDTKGSTDQHYCPIIWADNDDILHILYGCHKTAGTHLVSKKKAAMGESRKDWNEGAEIRYSLSYPTVYTIYDNHKVIYFRTGEHRSSWSYLISKDEGKTWSGPEQDVVDLNLGGDGHIPTKEQMENEMSSYQSVLPARDGKSLHVAFVYYDDNKHNIPDKFWNPRYGSKLNLGLKYNLYYVNIDLLTHEVRNFHGEPLQTPIDLPQANAGCLIWDTGWRGTGVPPDIILDENDHPAFLHVLSEDTPETFNYYYVRYVDGEWKPSVITRSNHEWNSGCLKRSSNGELSAYLIVGDNEYKSSVGKMDSRGGGARIEEWRSVDHGNTWRKARNLAPRQPEFAGWKYNNIQPIMDPSGKAKEGMYLFYGWVDSDLAKGKAFLLVE